MHVAISKLPASHDVANELVEKRLQPLPSTPPTIGIIGRVRGGNHAKLSAGRQSVLVNEPRAPGMVIRSDDDDFLPPVGGQKCRYGTRFIKRVACSVWDANHGCRGNAAIGEIPLH